MTHPASYYLDHPGAWRGDADLRPNAPEEALPAWTPFEAAGRSPASGADLFVNSRYLVSVFRERVNWWGLARVTVVRLGIENFDHSARHDWRDFQRIKNELVHPEAEAFEVYPAESRLLDPSNYFLLWVFPKGMRRLPVGPTQRRVLAPADAPARQRDLERP